MSGNYPWIMSGNYPWIMSGNYPLLYYDDAEKLRFIGILAYPKIVKIGKVSKFRIKFGHLHNNVSSFFKEK